MVQCELCKRNVHIAQAHHAVPRKLLKKNKHKYPNTRIYMCVDCNKMVHALFPLKELAEKYNTLEELKSVNSIIKYIEWVKDKPEGIVKHPRRTWNGGRYE